MGMVMMGAMFAGGVLGLIVTAVAGAVAMGLMARNAKRRPRAWRSFAIGFVIAMVLCIVAMQFYPYGTVRPGSDYDVMMKNVFIESLGYLASPGVAALLAALVILLTPGKRGTKAQRHEGTEGEAEKEAGDDRNRWAA